MYKKSHHAVPFILSYSYFYSFTINIKTVHLVMMLLN